ncbi:Sir2 silent information regulator family NAD-dependent deacetylase [Niallia circulans]|uniref:Sir2 silent information regulator family NAD-dependent deacetylase n=1 Tax=Niallia circulans TaxID=1397 RepID=A0A553SS70_NIACI|nr:Sir2 silent information regulator family NAD-dependent deacetylase [Niallia circulans]TRZ39843.1 Sir2 silent information regulator family NAD-dependent deacetylase [Niallia circulans]
MDKEFQSRIAHTKDLINKADYIVIGAGEGLSAAAGIQYGGQRFTDNFALFIEKYGLTDMYSSGFYPFPTEEERWAYWARHISLNRFEAGPTKLYENLLQLVKETNYFVITTNVDSQFELADFPSENIFEVQGNYGYLQCAVGCHDALYDNKLLVKEMMEKTENCSIPSNLVQKCPVCGGKMDPHLRINQYFVQNDSWDNRNAAYTSFIQESKGKNILFLEFGVGFNTPGIIRYPFEQMTYQNEHAYIIRFNKEHPNGPKENKDRTIAFTEDILTVLSELIK